MTQYRAEAADQVSVRTLDGITLLFHHPSGQTHLVVSPVPEILAALGEGPLSLEGLAETLSLSYDLGEEAEAQAELAAHIEALAAAGLVRSA